MATEKEVQQASDRVAKLRQQIADEQAKRADIAATSASDQTVATLKAEEERLKRQLDAEKAMTAHEKDAQARAVERAGYVEPVPDANAPAMNTITVKEAADVQAAEAATETPTTKEK